METFCIKTYGCAMNYADSNRIRNILNSFKLREISSWKNADIVVLVTCSIRQQAEDKFTGWGIKDLSNKTVIMTGCMSVRYDRQNNIEDNRYVDKLQNTFPWITHIINIKDINKIPKLLGLEKSELVEGKYSSDISKFHGLFPISHGCNNFCSYCIVPFARGPLINYKKSEILNDVKEFIEGGGKLVTLLGQNVNSWEEDNLIFTDLLKEVIDIKGDFWINFLSSHPKDFSDELIDLITTHPKILKSANIAAQSGSDRILKLMNRKYSSADFIDICKKIKDKNKDFRITTDIIVGFPTENNTDFQASINLINECEIEMAYVGKYSPREGSVSYEMTDDVSQDIKESREIEIKDAVNKIRDRKHRGLVDKELPILVLENNKGISYFNHDVRVDDCEGEIVNKKIKGCSRSGLLA